MSKYSFGFRIENNHTIDVVNNSILISPYSSKHFPQYSVIRGNILPKNWKPSEYIVQSLRKELQKSKPIIPILGLIKIF